MNVKYLRSRTFKSGMLRVRKERVMSRLLDLEDAPKFGSSSLIMVLYCLVDY